jgi:hypothetical protein
MEQMTEQVMKRLMAEMRAGHEQIVTAMKA